MASSALGAARAPAWSISSAAYPTNFPPDSTSEANRTKYFLDVSNVGGATSSGPITVTDVLPAGVAMDGTVLGEDDSIGPNQFEPPCAAAGQTVTCTVTFTRTPGQQFSIDIPVAVAASSGTLVNHASVAGGGASSVATTEQPTQVSPLPPPFAFVPEPAGLKWTVTSADGATVTQAGARPYQMTTELSLPLGDFNPLVFEFEPDQQVKNLTVDLPPGMVANPNAVAKCTEAQFEAEPTTAEPERCPPESQVGTIDALVQIGNPELITPIVAPLYSIVPPPGVPAEFGFFARGLGGYVHISGGVRTGSDYALSATGSDIYGGANLVAIKATLWGQPSDASHDDQRGNCSLEARPSCAHVPVVNPVPFLTMPSACSGPPVLTASAESWQGTVASTSSEGSSLSTGAPDKIEGCGRLDFKPTIVAHPDVSAADSSAGFDFNLRLPQSEGIETLAEATLKKAVVTLPVGATLNPSAAGGLQGCTESEIALHSPDQPSCPEASKVATVTIRTALLPKPLTGAIYLARPFENPDNTLVAGYIVAEGEGALIKLAGKFELDFSTGQVTATFDNNPQLPFDELAVHFFGGRHGSLATPQVCGVYTVNADLTPWTTPFGADALTNSSFSVAEGPGGAPCPPNPLPFAPTMTAGSATSQAGGFTPFTFVLRRPDAQQRVSTVSFTEPPGLAATISHVTLCGEPQAQQGACPAASQIGHAIVEAGVGSSPITVPQPGEPESPIYFTGPYNGKGGSCTPGTAGCAPFGLSIVTHVIAGPFDLGTIVTRAKIDVDPHTAQITVTTDPLPQIIQGVPTDLRTIEAVIDRPGFVFNPTNCAEQSFSGTATSSQGTLASLSSPFKASACRELAFAPKVAVMTAAHTSKANGASLLFNIVYPKGAIGTQSWFNEAKFDFPKQLPARLTTLQKACLAATFDANPAGCPPGSLIGHAVVHTPLLPVPLAGPVYFVSHGGAKFPDAVIVLQGEGITVDLVGETFINGKTSVTSATFRNTPDVPFENIEVTIPSGPASEFGANLPANAHGSFCGQKLLMPTLLKAQNGLEIHQNTPVGVIGCSSKIALKSHTLHKRTLTLSVYVPAAGKLTASGNGLSSSSKSTKGQEIATLTLHAKHAKHFNTQLKLTFKPGKGTSQATTSKVRA
ncbi:MAG TPA: hypothetical protein VGN13_07025 [Solirubrobacteraceae bacterium]